MAGGGKREGAGRPRVRDKYAAPVRAAEKKIVDRLPEIVDAQIRLAVGVMVEDVNVVTGDLTVYREPPDGKAGQYLINRILGLPKAKVDMNVDIDYSSLSVEQLTRIAAGEDVLKVLATK